MTHRQETQNLDSIDALLEGLVDYAGLFPPAAENMRTAVENYAAYRAGSDRRALARFIIPAGRLGELESEAIDLMPAGSDPEPWRLSALISGDTGAAMRTISDFNHRHDRDSSNGWAVVDAVELKVSSAAEIAEHSRHLSTGPAAYFEIPAVGDIAPLVAAIAAAGARAKLRTGGVSADAFPSPDAIVDFLAACQKEGIAFKATAGLHHPLRGEYRLTYEQGSGKAVMYGYINLFLAAALIRSGNQRDVARAMLLESDPASLDFGDAGIEWRGITLTPAQLRRSRQFAISFGSCSFREPIDELAQLTRTTRTGQL
jgi:hypothetical protein